MVFFFFFFSSNKHLNSFSLDQIFSPSFDAQMPLCKMLANSQCLVIGNLCQDETCSNQLNLPPPPTTCQTCLYLTRQGNDGICHLCKLLRNLIRLSVSDEADNAWPPLLALFSQTLSAHRVRQHYSLRSHERHIRGESDGLNDSDNHLHLYRIVIVSVDTWLAFRLGIINVATCGWSLFSVPWCLVEQLVFHQ